MANHSSKLFLFLLAALLLADALVAGVSGYHEYEGEGDEGGREEESGRGGREMPPEEGGGRGRRKRPTETSDRFILEHAKEVLRTEAGRMRVVGGERFTNRPMHLGFITMEPNSLFIPQYLDSSLILFVRRGEARIGSIYKDDLLERDLKTGDLFRVQAGSVFYLVNTAEGQRLHIIASIDTSESLYPHDIQSFFIGGGTNPSSVLAGFDHQTLATAMNVSSEEIGELLSSQRGGAIVYLSPEAKSPSVWTRFLNQEKHKRVAHMKKIAEVRGGEDKENEEEKPKWSWRKLLISMLGEIENRGDRSVGKKLDSYNIYDRKPDFRNNYGWSIEVNGNDYKPLKKSDIGVYLVNLTAGSMMAPHINPTATEYGVVLSGVGTIQIVYPNGTLAMNAEVSEGDVFFVPRYFPFCQVASRSGNFVFFGFSTSAHTNRPQFLVGKNSLFQTMMGPEFAASFGLIEERLREIVNAQREGTILPSPEAATGGGDESEGGGSPEKEKERVGLMERLSKDMVMGFD